MATFALDAKRTSFLVWMSCLSLAIALAGFTEAFAGLVPRG